MNASQAIQFNNLGVVLLEEGKRREAMELFKGASQLITFLVTQESPKESKAFPSEDIRIRTATIIYDMCTTDDGRNSTSLVDTKPSNSPTRVDIDLDDTDGTSKSFICNRAIPIAEVLLPSTWTQALAVCCSVVLYNMGLIFHLGAVDSVLETSGMKALRLYEMAFNLLSDENLELDTTLMIRLMMYCLNNMALINHQLTRWDLSSKCMDRLIVVATQIQTKGVCSALHQECQSFLLNAMVLKAPTRAPAA